MPKYELDHIHISSPNPLETARFYEDMMGAKIMGEGKMPDGRKNVNVDLNGLVIRIIEPSSLNQGDTTKSNGLDHIGFLTDDIEQSVAELKAGGAMIVKEIGPMRAGKMCFFMAPDNVLVELIEPGK
jgi:catechol 2,3-dioxygenase-like lactoylglutathione lyase family enzyme